MNSILAALLSILCSQADPLELTRGGAPRVLWLSVDSGGGRVALANRHGTISLGQADSWSASGGDYHFIGGFLAPLPSLPFFADGFESGNTTAWSANFGDFGVSNEEGGTPEDRAGARPH